MKTITLIVCVLLLSGCICFSQKTQKQPTTTMQQTTTTTSTTSTTSTSSTATTASTSTTEGIDYKLLYLGLLNSLKTTTTTSTTLENKSLHNDKWPQATATTTTITNPRINVPPEYTTCQKNIDCTLVGDCCPQGRQYSINKASNGRWIMLLKRICANVTKCVADTQTALQPYHYTICDNGTCHKTYNNPG